MLKNEYSEKVIMSILGVIVGIATNTFLLRLIQIG